MVYGCSRSILSSILLEGRRRHTDSPSFIMDYSSRGAVQVIKSLSNATLNPLKTSRHSRDARRKEGPFYVLYLCSVSAPCAIP